jgi:hypothetical protein
MIEVLDGLDDILDYLTPVVFGASSGEELVPKEGEEGHKYFHMGTGKSVLHALEVMNRRLFVEAFIKRLVEVGQDVTFIANLQKQLFAPLKSVTGVGGVSVVEELLMKWDQQKAAWVCRNRFFNMVLCLLDSLYYCSSEDNNLRLIRECLLRPAASPKSWQEDEDEGGDTTPQSSLGFRYKVEKKSKSPIRPEEYRFALYTRKDRMEEARVVSVLLSY